MIASLEVDSDNRVRVNTKVNRQNFKGDIIVVHLVVAESDIDVDGVEIFVLDQ